MKIFEIATFSTCLSLETVASKAIYVVQQFCREQNVFVEDIFYETFETNSFYESDNYQGIVVIISLEMEKLMELKKIVSALIGKYTEEDGECFVHWNDLTKELEQLD